VDHHVLLHFASDYRQERPLRAVGHDLGVDASVALEDAEHDRLAAGAAAALAPDAARAEVRLVDLDLAALERPAAFALVGQALAQAEVDVVHRADRDAAQPRRVGSRQVQREQAQDLAELRLAQLRSLEVAVFHGIGEVKSTSRRPFAS
jgi:hypothetical protein